MSMRVADIQKVIGSATEDEIAIVMQACQGELWARRENARKREKWVDEMYRLFLGHPNATDRREGNMTIMALYNRNNGVKIGIAKCSPEDTFSERVGLAVAYARAMGHRIPDYI